jgi:hypothetical protein
MPFNKIQPEQIQLPTFFSDSGDLAISQSDTGVQMNVFRDLTGDFSFTGNLLTNGKPVVGLAATGSNRFTVDYNSFLFKGSNTQIEGSGNIAIVADNTTISGENQVALNVTNSSFVASGSRNTAIGRNITFSKSTTGNLVLKDFSTSTETVASNTNNGLYVNFETGHFFNGGHTYFEKSICVEDSGIFSGTLNVLSDSLLSGSTIVNQEYLERHAGGSQKISGTYVFETGFQLPEWKGNGSIAGSVAAPATGAIAISGNTLLVYVGDGDWGGVAISGGNP